MRHAKIKSGAAEDLTKTKFWLGRITASNNELNIIIKF